MTTVTFIQHRTCGHIANLVNSPSLRPHLEATHRLLSAAGYHNWRVRTVEMTDEVALAMLAGPCDTCRVDPARVTLAKDGA